MEVELIDIIAPEITQLNPANSAIIAPGLETVKVDFSEYIAPETVKQDNFKVFDANDNLLVPQNIQQLNDGKTVELNFVTLAEGAYRLEINAAQITDLSGNALGSENIINTFSIEPARVTTLFNNIIDINPNREGIQAYENTKLDLRANIFEPDGGSIEQVDFFINDEIIATDTNGSIFSTDIYLPDISTEYSAVTISARGIDNNGEFSYTDPLEAEIANIFSDEILYPVETQLTEIARGDINFWERTY